MVYISFSSLMVPCEAAQTGDTLFSDICLLWEGSVCVYLYIRNIGCFSIVV